MNTNSRRGKMGGIAVLDVETTGLGRTDRIVEVGVVRLDCDGSELGSFTTLVNPRRDIGAGHIHGVTASDLTEAPPFADIAPYLASLLSGQLLVAHNAWFDLSFLWREFARAHVEAPLAWPAVCTMRSASALLGAPTSLETACTYLSIDLDDHHCALADAHAAADLLRLMAWDMRWDGGFPGCGNFEWDEAAHAGRFWAVPADLHAWLQEGEHAWSAPSGRGVAPAVCTRSHATARRDLADHRIAQWLTKLPLSGPESTFSPEYLNLIQQVLLDRQVTVDELRELEVLASQLDLDGQSVQAMHQHVLDGVAAAAWMDGVVTGEERADLRRVALLLGLPEEAAEESLAHCEKSVGPCAQGLLAAGDQVTFTGTMTVERSVLEALAEAVGLRHGSLTKRTTALVAADPNSESGKARKARQYGIPVIAEQTFRYEVEGLRGAREW
jgi:DNA polymerase-3 subunit epsilon